MTAEQLPEPAEHRALVGLFDPSGADVPLTFERDNSDFAGADDDAHWFAPGGDAFTFAEVLTFARRHRREVVRLYRADRRFHEMVDAFNAGVEAAAKAIEAHAESIGWYEGGGVWADAIEEARNAAVKSA